MIQGAHPVSILIPVYGAEEQLHDCLTSLVAFMPAGCSVHVLDDASPGIGVRQVVASFTEALPSLQYERRSTNLGFVANCNEGMAAVRDTGRDILLLNSDTRITRGAIEEMYAVLHLHSMHGAVCPRSNNASIYSVPVLEPFEADDSYRLWTTVKPLLKRYCVMPSAVGFCMLIRNSMLQHFGFFDRAYSPGYQEENDFVCRMNRRGYSAVAANWAFVFHLGSSSFGDSRGALEAQNREVLDTRYPEHARSVESYYRFHMDPVDRFAPVWSARQQKVLIDLYHLTPWHSGTSEFGIGLLLYLVPKLSRKYEVSLGLTDEGYRFFKNELVGYRFFDRTRSPDVFDLVFKPCQFFSWRELHRSSTLGVRICFTHQDSIAIRCRYLSAPEPEILHQNLPALVDGIFAHSEFSKVDFEAFYSFETQSQVIHLGAHNDIASTTPSDGYILVAGNAYEHKAVDQAVQELDGLRKIVVLGGRDTQSSRHISGRMGHRDVFDLFVNAAVVVYPSYYEGFGLPVTNSLAIGRDVVVLDTPVSRELKNLVHDSPKLHLAKTHGAMRPIVESILKNLAKAVDAPQVRTWNDVAAEYAQAIEDLLNRPVDVDRLRARWNWCSAIDSTHP